MTKNEKQANRILGMLERIDNRALTEDRREWFIQNVDSVLDEFDFSDVPDEHLEVIFKDLLTGLKAMRN